MTELDVEGLRTSFRKDGFVVIRDLISPEEIHRWRTQINELSNVHDADFEEMVRGTPRKWTMPGGVAARPEFQDLIFDERILAAVRAVLGDEVRYMHHNDLHAGFGSPGWHRDSVNRECGIGSDFDESDAPYRLVRVAFYLQTFQESGFKMGFAPGTHLQESKLTRWERRAPRVGTIRRWLIGQRLFTARTRFVPTNPGDVVLFDYRVMHCGGLVRGPKYSLYLGYGIQNRHFDQHWNYYRNIRTDLDYDPPTEALISRLQAADLWPLEPIEDRFEVENAYVPTRASR